MGQYARPVQRFKAARLYKNDPQAREALDRLNARAEADPGVTKEAYLGAERRIIVAAQQRKNELKN